MRAPGFFSVLLVAALIAALPAAATGQAAGGGPAANLWFAAPSFDARGGFEQLFVTDADPGSALTASIAGTSEVDDLGSVMFRDLSPGHYIVATSGTVNWGVEVGSAEGSTPEHSFYDDQEINEGFTYVETRDGTTLSAYVVLPGPVEDGPYPTVVDYSGYNPSDPFSGLGGGFDATPLCGSLPTLCKAPAQPGSQLAGLFGYATVGVNVRGTGCSGGAYDFFETMQVLDGFDVIEAVAAQPWVKDHEVGMVGLSYPGISQLFVAQSNPPSLGAITPLSVYGDTAILAPGGLLNTGFATSWADQVLRNAESCGTGWVRRAIDEGDAQCDANQQLRGQNVDATAKARSQPFCTDEVAAPLDTREFAGDIEAAVFLTSAFQDE
jgi:predicted acyl esterase